ncbi:MAG: TIM barrel protein [Anaerotruncus sp.]|nr:TIM barrel protein [Anaerotruncus sp.]
MREPIQKYFQMGIIAAMAYPAMNKADAQQAAQLVRSIACDPFFDAIELNPCGDAQTREALTKVLRQSHMRVCYSAHGRLLSAGLNPNDLEEQGRQKAEAALIAGVEEAHELGLGGIAFLSGHWAPETQQQAVAQLVKTTQNVCRYAAQKGMFVELEVFDSDIAKKSLLGPAALAAEYAAQVRCKCNNFGLMLDLSHFPMCYEDSRYILRTLRPYVTHLHFGNTVIAQPELEAYGDEHPRFGFPHSENDTAQLLEFLRVLQQEGFFCAKEPYVLSMEVKPWRDETPEVVVANTKRVFQRAWALL